MGNKIAASLLMVAAGITLAAPSVVKVVGTPGNYQLTFNGKPYFAEGAGGGGPKDLLRRLGGNSFRTWGAGNAEKELGDALVNGQTVMIGFWLNHANDGMDYTNAAALERREKEILADIRRLKDHPALLCWALGNEMEMNNPHTVEMWRWINSVALKVKTIDPNHPVCSVIAELGGKKVSEINTYAPDLDFIGINTYGGAPSAGERWIKDGGTRPYMLTEFGPPGTWEWKHNSFGCPIEKTSTEKYDWYREVYEKGVKSQRGKWCIGSYAFTWGHKVEATPTWYGLLLPDWTILGGAEAMQDCWGHTKPANRCPRIQPVVVDKDDLQTTGEIISASCSATDPEGDKLSWKWVLILEGNNYGVNGTGLPTPPGFPNSIIEGQGTPKVKVKLPGGGKYRLYAYCFDGKGNGAYANIPLRGVGAEPKVARPKANIPCAVYKDDAETIWYPSGYMGNTQSIHVDEKCTENPHSGRTCLKLNYSQSSGWGGIFWQDPPNDWGDRPGGRDLTGADTLVFWARGENGGEKLSFFGGTLNKAKYPDSCGSKIEITLTKEWHRYRIPFDAQDLSCVKTGFGLSFGANAPFTIYLDDIEWVAL